MKVSSKGHVATPRTHAKRDKFSRGKRVLAALLHGGKVKGCTQDWLRLTRGPA